MAKVSIIIPCYNHGLFLAETLESVHQQSFSDIEIIIVNDGSTDDLTRQILLNLSHPDIKVIHTSNQGLAAARNNGILAAQGKYILPLDADDRIGQEYIEQAVTVLDSNPSIGIVYSKAQLFGAVDTEWLLPEYSLRQMLLDNLIFCSALFRRSDWEIVGGYDSGMIYGWEDYDFWLSLIEIGRGVYQIPEILFYYRVASNSMVRSKEKWQKVSMFKRIYERHKTLFSDNIEVWLEKLLDANEKYYTSRLYVDCGQGISDASSVSLKIDQGTPIVHFQLDQYKGIKNLRFDPVDSAAIIELLSVTCSFTDGTERVITEISDNSLLKIDKTMYFDTNDSQCFFSLTMEELKKIQSVTVALSYKALGEEALNKTLKELKKRMRKERKVASFAAKIFQ